MTIRSFALIVLLTNVVAGAAITFTPHSGVGAVIVMVTTIELVVLVLVGRRRKSAEVLWAGLCGLVWLAVFAGFALDLKADRRVKGARESSGVIVQAYGLFLDKVYLPLTRVEKGSGPETLYSPQTGKSEPVSSIIELRCLLDAGNNRYRERHVPSMANLSRYVASLSAWLVAGCAALVIRRPGHRTLTVL